MRYQFKLSTYSLSLTDLGTVSLCQQNPKNLKLQTEANTRFLMPYRKPKSVDYALHPKMLNYALPMRHNSCWLTPNRSKTRLG